MTRQELTIPRFSQADVVTATGLPAKTLQNYSEREVFEVYSPNPGKGQRRLYSVADIVLLAGMKAVSGFDIPPRTAGNFANHVRAWMLVETSRYRNTERLPEWFFLFCPAKRDDEANLPDMMLQGADLAALTERASQEGHLAFLLINGKRLITETLKRLSGSSDE